MRCIRLLSLLVVAGPAQATVLANWSVDEVVTRSDRVVVGVVVERRAGETTDQPLTETLIRVERTLRGEAAKTLVVSQYGGRRGDLLVRIPGDGRLPIGRRVLVVTRRHRDGRDYLVGMSLGVYQVIGDQLHQSIEVPLVDDDGQLRLPPGARQLRLADVVAAIERLQ